MVQGPLRLCAACAYVTARLAESPDGHLCVQHLAECLASGTDYEAGWVLSRIAQKALDRELAEKALKRQKDAERRAAGDLLEREVLHQVQRALDDAGVRWMRIHSGAQRDETGKIIGTAGEPGAPDLLCFPSLWLPSGALPLTVLALEAKSSSGVQKPAQKHWQTKWEARGGVYRLVRSGPEALQAVADARRMWLPKRGTG